MALYCEAKSYLDPDIRHQTAPTTFRGDKERDVKLLDGEKQGKRLVDYLPDGYEASMFGIVTNNPLRDPGWHDIFSVPCRSENDFDVSSSRKTSGEMEWSIPRSRG